MKLIKKLRRLLKREKKHLHEKGAWRYNKNMEKVNCNEDEF